MRPLSLLLLASPCWLAFAASLRWLPWPPIAALLGQDRPLARGAVSSCGCRGRCSRFDLRRDARRFGRGDPGLFANPLASPDLTGTTSGAALWARWSPPICSASRRRSRCRSARSAARSGALLLLLALAGPRAETATLLLAGLAISALAGALTTLALALAPSPFAFYDAYDWLMGSLVDRSLEQAAFAALPAFVAILLLLRLRARSTA
jgi:iron complex transport system permease protein